MNAYDHNGDQLSVGDYVMCLSNGCELENEIVSILPDNQIEVVPCDDDNNKKTTVNADDAFLLL